jgi:hypothetical protein
VPDTDHVTYFQTCADVERELASIAPAEYIARIHSLMADLYDALAHHPEGADKLQGVADLLAIVCG